MRQLHNTTQHNTNIINNFVVGDDIKDKGMIALAKALKINKTLTKLNLRVKSATHNAVSIIFHLLIIK